MNYKSFFNAKDGPNRNFDIKYVICEENDSYHIEAFVEGGRFFEKAFIGNCGEEKATELVKLFAKKDVHPVHIEDIISDMRF